MTKSATSKIFLASLIVTGVGILTLAAGHWSASLTAVPSSEPTTVKTFTSASLGISFQYLAGDMTLTDAMGDPDTPVQVGNTVWLDPDNTHPLSGGQWVRVFPKAAAETLQEAITRALLQGFSPKQCFVVAYARNPKRPDLDLAGISYPQKATDDPPAWITNTCPRPYAETNMDQYFAEDTKHPDHFVFVELGQELPISDGHGGSWDRSIAIK